MSTIVAKNLTVQNSAGTASTNISFDGNKLVSTALDNSITATANLHDLGVGQTWQNVTASRASGVTYTNSTGKPIAVSVLGTYAAGAGTEIDLSINGIVIDYAYTPSGGGNLTSVRGIIPQGAEYKVTSNRAISKWSELR